jgi:8-oxo-dGTP pyrophosphatase MutT (NUDIX family)
MERPSLAGKAVIEVEGGRIIVVAGKSGRATLPGGTLRDDETFLEAMHREVYEELGLPHLLLGAPQRAFREDGPTTSADGLPGRSVWVARHMRLLVPYDQAPIRLGKDIAWQAAIRPENFSELPIYSDIALGVIRQYMQAPPRKLNK